MPRFMFDAGHGYTTSGKQSVDGMKEYEFNRVVANYCQSLLFHYQDVVTYFSHNDKVDVSLDDRVTLANKMNIDVFISIHANAHGNGKEWTSAQGIETFVYTTKPKEAYALAIKVQNQLLRHTGRNNRGVKTANFQVLRETNMTSILVECGFMTNKEEAKLLKTDSYRKQCAVAIVEGLVEQYKLKKKVVIPKPSESVVFRVVTGSFSDRDNAEKRISDLKKKGFDSFIDIHKN